MCKIVIWPHQKPDCIKIYVVAASSHWSHRDCRDYRGYREGAAHKNYKAPRVLILHGSSGKGRMEVPSSESRFSLRRVPSARPPTHDQAASPPNRSTFS